MKIGKLAVRWLTAGDPTLNVNLLKIVGCCRKQNLPAVSEITARTNVESIRWMSVARERFCDHADDALDGNLIGRKGRP